MSEPMLGEIKLFAGSFAPRGWMDCAGQLISINENTALYSLLGTAYGGDGRTSFGVPDLRGRVPIGEGSAPGRTPRRPGDVGGSEHVTLAASQMPAHDHPVAVDVTADATATAQLRCNTGEADTDIPTGNILADARSNIYLDQGQNETMHPDSVQVDVTVTPNATVQVDNAGGGQPHENMPPFQCVRFIIALEGYYPSRS